MDTRQNYGRTDVYRGLKGAAFIPPDSARDRWHDMQPVLLMSAGIVGLAGIIVTVISSGVFFVEPIDARRQSTSQAAIEQNAPEATIVAVGSVDEEEPELELRAAPFVEEEVGAAEPDVVEEPFVASVPALTADPPLSESPSATAPFVTASIPVRTGAPVVSDSLAAVAPSASATTIDDVLARAHDDAIPTPEEEAPVALTDDAARCPRDWLEAEEAEGSTDCEGTIALVQPVEEADRSQLELAAAQHAMMLAGFVPRIPQPRPDPPPTLPTPVRAKTRSRLAG